MFEKLILMGMLFVNSAVCAGFDLFNQDRGKPPDPPPAPQQPAPPAPAQPAPPPAPKPPPPPQRDFVLKGTTKLGKNYQVFLQTPDGKDIVQEWEKGKTPEIEGFGDFKLINVTRREVVIGYPDNSPCQLSHLDRGVICAPDQKTATLKLIRGNPSAPKPPPAAPPPLAPAQTAAPPNAAQLSPEAQRLQTLFQQAAQQNQPPAAGNQPPPAGMKVVKTPFGDRLVPESK
ncbi:MAG: hypothetical protein RIT27_1861 [Pseudomonadota bacterium]|jgi:hypothetical protein